MPLMYLAKVNINSTIFKVYENELKIEHVLNEIYQKLDSDSVCSDYTVGTYVDDMGNPRRYKKKSTYQFKELNKIPDNMVITGKLVRSFNKPTEDIDEVRDKVIESITSESVSIYFYFDVRNELITFSERQSFGYNQFTTAFNGLLNNCIPDYGFEVFLQKDEDVLEDKIKSLKYVNRVVATLIPPNANEDELQEFRENLLYIQECQETNAKKYKVDLSVPNKDDTLNMESKYMKDVTKAVSRGYGDMTTYGINHNDREETVRSNKDAAMTRKVNDNLDRNAFAEESSSFIAFFLRKVLERRSERH